jgi:hypothetical protein
MYYFCNQKVNEHYLLKIASTMSFQCQGMQSPQAFVAGSFSMGRLFITGKNIGFFLSGKYGFLCGEISLHVTWWIWSS